MDSSSWALLKDICSFLWVPLGFVMTIYMNKKKKDDELMSHMEARINNVEQRTQIHGVQIDGIKETLKDVKSGVDKLVDRLIK